MKNLTLEEFKKIDEDRKATGLSIRDYCNNTGFEESKFYYWRKKLSDSLLPQTNGFVPLQMTHRNGKFTMASAAVADMKSASDAACEIVYRNGVTLRVNSNLSLDMLRSLILLCQ